MIAHKTCLIGDSALFAYVLKGLELFKLPELRKVRLEC